MIGDRVRVNSRITEGRGVLPKVGDRGTIERHLENGTVVVKLDDGRRAILASWELDYE
jgi:hypothetical protein